MKSYFIGILGVWVIIGLSGCLLNSMDYVKGNGDLIEEQRSLDSYHTIELNGSNELEVVEGIDYQLKIIAESNLMEFIRTEVKSGKLVISTEKNVRLKPSEKIKLVATTPQLEKLRLNGSGQAVIDLMGTENAELTLNGSGKIIATLNSNGLEAAINGSGDMMLKGNAKSANLQINGSGDLFAGELIVREANARISGSGDMHLFVSNLLTATITGSGDILYGGNPELDIKTTGSGRVKPL